MSIRGSIRYKRVYHDDPVQLSSGVSLSEGVKVWIESLRKAGREAACVRKGWSYPVDGNLFLEVIDVRLVQWFDRL